MRPTDADNDVLTHERTKGRKGEPAWKIHADELKDHFWLRQISRREAKELEDPRGPR